MIGLIIVVIVGVVFFATLIFFQGAFYYGKDEEDMIIDAPCKDCSVRMVGCHSSCVPYINYQAENKRLREQEKQERRKQNHHRRFNNKP